MKSTIRKIGNIIYNLEHKGQRDAYSAIMGLRGKKEISQKKLLRQIGLEELK